MAEMSVCRLGFSPAGWTSWSLHGGFGDILQLEWVQGHMLPTNVQVWSRMKKFQKNDALKIENVLRNEKTKLISIKYGTPEEAAKAKKSLESMSIIFHAKRVRATTWPLCSAWLFPRVRSHQNTRPLNAMPRTLRKLSR